jgi:hypothetical protein
MVRLVPRQRKIPRPRSCILQHHHDSVHLESSHNSACLGRLLITTHLVTPRRSSPLHPQARPLLHVWHAFSPWPILAPHIVPRAFSTLLEKSRTSVYGLVLQGSKLKLDLNARDRLNVKDLSSPLDWRTSAHIPKLSNLPSMTLRPATCRCPLRLLYLIYSTVMLLVFFLLPQLRILEEGSPTTVFYGQRPWIRKPP